MLINKCTKLRESLKLELLFRLFQKKELGSFLQRLDDDELLEARRFVWEKTIEFGIRLQGREFSHEKILRQLKACTGEIQQKCADRSLECGSYECLRSKSACAMANARCQVLLLARILGEFW
jgi:hypothetical protein